MNNEIRLEILQALPVALNPSIGASGILGVAYQIQTESTRRFSVFRIVEAEFVAARFDRGRI